MLAQTPVYQIREEEIQLQQPFPVQEGAQLWGPILSSSTENGATDVIKTALDLDSCQIKVNSNDCSVSNLLPA